MSEDTWWRYTPARWGGRRVPIDTLLSTVPPFPPLSTLRPSTLSGLYDTGGRLWMLDALRRGATSVGREWGGGRGARCRCSFLLHDVRSLRFTCLFGCPPCSSYPLLELTETTTSPEGERLFSPRDSLSSASSIEGLLLPLLSHFDGSVVRTCVPIPVVRRSCESLGVAMREQGSIRRD